MSDDRLERAIAAATPPRDPAFTLAVLRAAENARYKRDRFRRMIIAAALAGDASLILIVAAYLITANPGYMMIGVSAVALCAALLLVTRSATRIVKRSA